MNNRVLAAIATVLFVIVAACGDDGDPETATADTNGEASPDPAPEATPRPDVQNLELVGCERIGVTSAVEAAPAEALIPADRELLVTPAGQAIFALQHLSCDDLLTDGVSHGPGRFATAWIGIVGPEEPPALPAETDLVAAPTDYFHSVLWHTDNEGFAAATAEFGIPMTRADLMTLDPTVAGTQTGSAVNTSIDPPLSYELSVENTNEGDVAAPAVHTVLGTDDEGAPLTYFGTFTHQPGFIGNPATLTLEPGSAWDELLGTGFVTAGNGTEIDVSMVVFRDSATA